MNATGWCGGSNGLRYGELQCRLPLRQAGRQDRSALGCLADLSIASTLGFALEDSGLVQRDAPDNAHAHTGQPGYLMSAKSEEPAPPSRRPPSQPVDQLLPPGFAQLRETIPILLR